LVAVSVAAGLALLIGGCWLSWERGERRRQQLLADVRQAEADGQALLAEERHWQALVEEARGARLTGNRWRALELLAQAARFGRTGQLRQEAILAATPPRRTSASCLAIWPRGSYCVHPR
jgi:hypothetical protein